MNANHAQDRCDKQPPSDSEQPSQAATTTSEAWLRLPVLDRRTAAYQAGRLVNRLNFHLQESFVFGGPDAHEIVDTVFDQLMRISHSSLVNASTPLQNAIARLWEEWRSSRESEELADERWDAVLDETGYETGSEEEVLESLVDRWASPLIKGARAAFTEQFSDEERRAFELGEWVDQGVCRQDVHQFMYKPPRADPKEIRVEAPARHVQRRKRVIANYMPKPGEMPPSRFWSLRLPAFCADAGIPNAIPESLHLSPESTREQILSVVEEADRRIRAALAELGADGGSRNGLQQGTTVIESQQKEIAAAPRPRRLGGREPTPAAEGATPDTIKWLREVKGRIDQKGQYIGDSLPILRVFENIRIYNRSPEKPILILGEKGTGKTEIAELIHSHSGRTGQFRREHAVYQKGTDPRVDLVHWTGAAPNSGIERIPPEGIEGILEICRGGTIFIDELAVASEHFQELLLDVAERREVHKAVGTDAPKSSGPFCYIPDVRLLLATNRNPDELVDQERLRDDLFDRIGTRQITIPRLDERGLDILHLAGHFCDVAKGEKKYRPTWAFRLTLLRYRWPGNVRELKETIDLVKDASEDGNRRLTVDLLRLHGSGGIAEAVQEIDEDEAKKEVIQFVVDRLEQRVLPVNLQNFWADRDDGEMRRLRGPGGWGKQTRSGGTGGDVRQDGDRDVPEVASDSW